MTALGFYAYEHTRNDTGAVFYVGKGRGRRAAAAYNRNVYWRRVVAKAGGFGVRLIADEVDEELAFLIEIERIDQLKKAGVNLCNMTDGGEGTSGFFPSEETCRKMSAARSGERHPQFGKPKSEATKQKLRVASTGKTLSAEAKAKISAAILGRKESDETRLKKSMALSGRPGKRPSDETRHRMSQALKGKPKSEIMRKRLGDARRGKAQPVVACPHCNALGGVSNMKRWHFNNCHFKAI